MTAGLPHTWRLLFHIVSVYHICLLSWSKWQVWIKKSNNKIPVHATFRLIDLINFTFLKQFLKIFTAIKESFAGRIGRASGPNPAHIP